MNELEFLDSSPESMDNSGSGCFQCTWYNEILNVFSVQNP